MADPKGWMSKEPREPIDLRTDIAHGARVYDVLLGGKTNYAADREAARRLMETLPIARLSAVENRAFMHRAVDFLAAEAGIRQFLDIGTGIPTPPNLHEVAQAVIPTARVVYADNDPIVLTHSRALHLGTPQGRTAYIHGDLTEPSGILRHPDLAETLDLTEPVAITLLTVLHWLPPGTDAHAIVRQLLEVVPSGSYLVVTHITSDFEPSMTAVAEDPRTTGSRVTPRTEAQVRAFFDGLELVEPGIRTVQDWRPAAPAPGVAVIAPARRELVPLYAGVARKP